MAEMIQQPDVVGNYLSRYYQAQQHGQQQQDRQFNRQRLERADERDEQQFSGQMDAQRIEHALKRGQLLAQATASVQDGDEQGFTAAKEQLISDLQATPEEAARIRATPISRLPALRLESGIELKKLELAHKRAQIAAQQANAAQSYASADAARSLAANRGGMGNLPTRLQAAEDEDISAIQTVQSIGAQLDAIDQQIQSGELDLGPVNNAMSRVQNFAGLSNEGSVNFATMMSTLEKMRNDSLILNKGVQTEGDAVRAWNALIANVNDPAVVKAQIARIKKLNDIAAQQKVQLINIRRDRNAAPKFDPGQIAPPQGNGGWSVQKVQ